MKEILAYILFPHSNNISTAHLLNNENLVLNEEDGLNKFLKELKKSIQVFAGEREVEVFYDAQNVQVFLEGFEEELIDYYLTNPADTISEFLDAIAAKNIQNERFDPQKRFFIWELDNNEELHSTPYQTIQKIASKHIQHSIIFNHQALTLEKPLLALLIDAAYLNDHPELIKIPVRNNETDLIEWLQTNRTQRVFNLSPKHGENGQGSWGNSRGNKVDILECSRERAQELLDTAIGEMRISTRKLFNYDTEVGQYILFYFEGENPQNQYHGFHISNKKIRNEVPNKIQGILKGKYNF